MPIMLFARAFRRSAEPCGQQRFIFPGGYLTTLSRAVKADDL
ncbi:hypothetical protein L083_3291 [Actinoplanes sp. N902-109]|nr:hypothetical protein L083_3291 [Actinoplanes sp. N902-109]